MRRAAIACLAMLGPTLAHSDVEEAVSLFESGQHEQAFEQFERLATAGNTKAMVTDGTLYYEGKGVDRDYGQAMQWYLRALPENGDAFVNIGVLYRDGLGVQRNLEVAYDIFVIAHMRRLGSDNTQIRNGRNLHKAIAVMSQDQIKRALCFTEQQVIDVLQSQTSTALGFEGSDVPIKDMDWWFEGELPEIDCDEHAAR